MANRAIAKICLNRFCAVTQEVGEIFLTASAPLENEPGELLDESLGMEWNQAIQVLHRPAIAQLVAVSGELLEEAAFVEKPVGCDRRTVVLQRPTVLACGDRQLVQQDVARLARQRFQQA